MSIMSIEYKYEELRAKAIAADATDEDIANLAEWFELYGMSHWNGECFDADGYQLYPVQEEVAEDEWKTVGWELR